jgi:hypothetical protein
MNARVDLPALKDVRGGVNVQTKSTAFSCPDFKQRQGDAVKGDSTCRSGESDPGMLGTKGDSNGNSTKNAASIIFSPAMPRYSVFGLFAFLFML